MVRISSINDLNLSADCRVEDPDGESTRTAPGRQQLDAFREASDTYTEADLQRDVVTWAWAHEDERLHLLRAFPNDGPRQYAYGVVKGTPDLLLPIPSGEYSALWLELKRLPNDISEEQYSQMRTLHGHGHAVEVAWTQAQARWALMSYLQDPAAFCSGW